MRTNHCLENTQETTYEKMWQMYFDSCSLDLNSVLPITLSLSQQSHCAVGFYNENDVIFAIKNQKNEKIFFEIKDLSSFNLNAMNEQVKHHIQSHTDIAIKQFVIFTLKDPKVDGDIIFVFFSENLSPILLQTTKLLQDYLNQQSHFATLKFQYTQSQSKLESLEETHAGRMKYFSVISHDLRAPFHGILGCVDILMHEAEDLGESDKNKLIEYIYDTSHSTYNLLENLLNWSMTQGGRLSLKKIHFRVSDVVQMILDLLCASAYRKQIKIECELEAGLYVYADINMVTSILQNLVSNALKFTRTHANKKIIIKTFSENDQIKITVKDEGVGLTQAQQERLFKEQSISSTPGTKGEKGTGLGLVLCKRFVEMNDGKISVSSVVDQGTTFQLFFPKGNKNS